MRAKLDENVPTLFGDLLQAEGWSGASVAEEGLSGAPDPAVLGAASSEGRVLFTFDTDFADVRAYPPGTHAGVVVLRFRDQRWSAVKEPLRRLVASGVLARLQGGLAIVDETRVRLRALGPADRGPEG